MTIASKNNYRTDETTGKPSSSYNTWRGMKQRCSHPSQKCYHNYGGRGIQYCRRWESFDNFIEDMGPKPVGMTLDRINVNGPYEKDNCRWVTNAYQQKNRRDNFLLTYKGVTMTMTDWAKHLGMPKTTLQGRLRIGRWTIEKALTTPIDTKSRRTGKKAAQAAQTADKTSRVVVNSAQIAAAMQMVFENAGLMTDQGVI